jgi:DNA-binding GntR family transcriptional regulator
MGERVNSKAEQVYSELKEAILVGALEPGAPIDKIALCDRFGMSRFPVSAAVSRLAFESLVVIEPQHGSFVARISAAEVRERMFIRRSLEREIAAEAARRMPPEGLEALEENLARAQEAVEAGDRTAFYLLDVGFHQVLTTHLGLRRSSEVLDGLRSHLERVRRMLMLPAGRNRDSLAGHVAIAAAITAGDVNGARATMDRHLAVTTENFEAFARERPELILA